MAIPDFQSIMLPFLQVLSDGQEHSMKDMVNFLAGRFALTQEELAEMLPSRQARVFLNRVAWAKTHLKKAGLLDNLRRGWVQLSETGKQTLAEAPERIDMGYLRRFEGYRQFTGKEKAAVDLPCTDADESEVSQEVPSFTWKPIYAEIANRLLEYRNSNPQLVDILLDMQKHGLKVSPLLDQDAEGKGFTLQEIDPFTFLANFNRGVTPANRTAMLHFLKGQWGLTSLLPNDYDGIPLVNAQNTWFMPFKADRNPDHVDTLWQLFEHVQQLPTDAQLDTDLFDRCLKLSHVGPAYLTMGLFWVRPDRFAALDKNNLALAASLGITVKRPKTGIDYITWLDMLVEKSGPDFADFSYRAHQAAAAPDEDEGELAPPYDLLFGDHARANRVLDCFATVVRALVTDETAPDARISIGIQRWSGQRIRLRLVYAKWAVFGFRMNNGVGSYQIVLPADDTRAHGLEDPFEFRERIDDVAYVLGWIRETDFEQERDVLLPALTDALRAIRNHFAHWTSSPYAASNRPALYSMIVEKNLRATGLEISLEPDPSHDDDVVGQNDGDVSEIGATPSISTESTGQHLWWLNANPSQWNPADVPVGTEEWYSVHGASGALRRLPQAFQQARPGDKLLIYVTSPHRYLWGSGTITAGMPETGGQQI